MRFVKPLDTKLIAEIAASHELIVTVEENVVAGGAGAGVNEVLNELGYVCPVVNLGLPDEHIAHGSPSQMLADCGLDAASIAKRIQETLPDHRARA